MKSPFVKGIVFLLIAAFSYGIMPIFALKAYDAGVNVATALFFRFLLTGMFFWMFSIKADQKMTISKSNLMRLLFIGLVCYNLQNNLYFQSFQYIPTSLSVLLLYVYPIIISIVSFFLGLEKFNLKSLAAILISFLGLILTLSFPQQSLNMIGVSMGLGAALLYSIYILLNKKVLQETSTYLVTSYLSLFTAIGIALSSNFTGGIQLDFQPRAWLYIALIFGSNLIAMGFFLLGLKIMSPLGASGISMSEPVFNAILSFAILGQKLTILQILGGFLAMLGTFLIIRYQHEKIEREGLDTNISKLKA